MKKTLQSLTVFAAAAFSLFSLTPQAKAHCEVPCGIYSDETVFVDLFKHVSTIEKATLEIQKLSKNPTANANQLVRWVNNKESHATKIQEVVAQYFLTQRVKMDEFKKNKSLYLLKLTQLHNITVIAMQCKQTTDLKKVELLHDVIDEFKATYYDKH